MAVPRVAALLAAVAVLAAGVIAQQRAPCDGLAEYPRPRFDNQYWGAHIANLRNEVIAADQPGQARSATACSLCTHAQSVPSGGMLRVRITSCSGANLCRRHVCTA